jgi:hypothetical protein
MVAPTHIKPVAPALASLGKAQTHQTNPQDKMVVKSRPNFLRRGLAVGNPRYKSNKELTLLITNNS